MTPDRVLASDSKTVFSGESVEFLMATASVVLLTLPMYTSSSCPSQYATVIMMINIIFTEAKMEVDSYSSDLLRCGIGRPLR